MIEVREVTLTPREQEVCRLILKGFPAKEIARILDIAPRTVDQHTLNIRGRLGAENRAHMAAHLLVRGLITMTVEDL